MDLEQIKCFMLDMDGTIYLGNELISGALDFLKTIENQNKEFIFLTNNSSKNSKAYKAKLESMGCIVSEERVFTSGEATAIYLEKIKKGAKLFVLGTEYLEEEFEKRGFVLIKDRSEVPDYVVLGFDTSLTYEKLWIACDHIRDGVQYIATHPDYNCPLEGGKFMPDVGAMISLIEASTGKLPEIIGKPYKHIVDAIVEKYNLDKNQVAMVGDRLYTDIKLGANSGITSILVLSGETTCDDYDISDVKADYVFTSVKELGNALAGKEPVYEGISD